MAVDKLNRDIDKLSLSFYKEENKAKYETYIGVEKLVAEFLKLALPRDSEILSPSSGPGLITARLLTKGYLYIDAMVRCRDELAGIDANDIYRHVICRQLSGINSTGLRDDVYDAVVMVGVGGFGDHPATVLGEMIRITKPEGHILWTLCRGQHEMESDYGLLNKNLLDLEAEGKIVVMKKEEAFTDPHSGLDGCLYLLKKLVVTEDFKPTGVPKASVLPSLVNASIKEIEAYADQLPDNFTGHLKLCQAFFKLRLQRDVGILDVSSHVSFPGLVGRELSLHGYENVDGLDHAIGPLDTARVDHLYRNYIIGNVDELGSIPVRDESYEVILIADGFAPGKILPTAFDELLRVLRPGGYIMWTMSDGLAQECPDHFAHFDHRIMDLAQQRRWELLVGPVFFEKFSLDQPGRFYMLRKCHREIFAKGSPRHSPSSSPRLLRRGSMNLKNY